MDITPDQARQELARRELARRQNKIGQVGPAKWAWNALGKAEPLSRAGLQMIASKIPQGKITGNLPMDLARGTPRIAADTLAQVAPGFVSRGSMMATAAAPIVGEGMKALAPIGKSIAGGLEDWSGIRPQGSLTAEFKDPSLIFARGTEAAKPLYEAGKAEAVPLSKSLETAKEEAKGLGAFKGMYKPEQIVDKAQEVIGKGGKLGPADALTYRKAIDILAKSGRYVKDELFAMRQEADAMVKESETMSDADRLHLRGKMAQGLRSLFPKNVGGRASPFKVGEALAISQLGPMGKAASLMFSPAILGAGSGALGLANQVATNPQASNTAIQVLRQLRKKRNENINPQ